MTPIGGGAKLFFLLIGSITPGGVGTGLYDMLLISIIAIFIAGLMVGRTPEIPRQQDLHSRFQHGRRHGQVRARQPGQFGSHGLTEMIHAYAATASDNGSAFGGLNANTPWFNVSTAIAMLAGRFLHGVPILALAGALAAKTRAAPSTGTFPTHGPLFVGLLVGVILIVGLLIYFPALALGPIVEHFAMLGGKTF
jgi:K+-transporting ATPase ATPase A chain